MQPIEIIVIVSCILIVGGVIANYFYKKAKKIPTGECECCKSKRAGKTLVDAYHKKYNKNCK